ncbi:MAG: hypothetical protein LBR08_03370 [Bacteroidales bacterium]|jgi:hypothetical protein|nr:hypothetical protein [Bacteroidales bacterium]
MKNILWILVFVLGAGANVVHAQVKAVVASVTANRTLYTAGFTDVSINVIGMVSDRFNVQTEVSKVKDFIYSELSKDFPFTLIPESDFLANTSFQEHVASVKNNAFVNATKAVNDRVGVDGYLYTVVKSDVAKALECFSAESVNAVMVIAVDCYLAPKVLIGGNGSALAKIKVTVSLWNKDYKVLMDVSAESSSEQTFGIAAGQIVSNREKIPDALAEASDAVFKNMKESMPKAIKKFEKKLSKYKM